MSSTHGNVACVKAQKQKKEGRGKELIEKVL